MSGSIYQTRDRSAFLGSSFVSSPLEQIRTLIVSFVQGLFNGAPVGSYHWEPEDENTEIIIRDENPINVEKIGQRPAINFTMGGVDFYNVGMDDLLDYSFSLDKKTKGILVPGVISINCSSRTDIEVHNLAWIVAEHIWLLRELLLKQGFFEIGRGLKISPPSPAGSLVSGDMSDEWTVSTVSVPWQIARKSAFTPLGKVVVNRICEFVHARTPKPVESLGWPSDLSGHPFSISECMPPSFAPEASDAYGNTPDPAGTKSNPLPLVPHPLNPAKIVTVRTVRPYRAGLRRNSSGRAPALPIDERCVVKSEVAT